MRIGITTLYGDSNYGNRLQNYAVQELLKSKGFDVDTLLCEKNICKSTVRNVYHGCKSFLGNKKSKRILRVRQFNKEIIHTRVLKEKSGLYPSRIAQEYDFFVTGSDQVWNPDLRLKEKDNFFLRFARREQRICLSASIAAEKIPQSCMTEFLIGLNGFPHLSCREKAGSELIEQLTGRKCENIIDPTLAIDAQTWRTFSQPVSQERPYILLFFLGGVSKSLRMQIQEEAQKRELEIVELSSPDDKHYVSDPRNFTWLIDHAELVLTDSFHGAAFSINMNTPFYVFDRASEKAVENRMNSRIVGLTDKFCLSERYVRGGLEHLEFACCFDQSNAVLKAERKKFNDYLEECLTQKERHSNFLPDRSCTGCGVCEKVCPRNCIKMEPDAEGFLRPVVDYPQCVSCGKCTCVCPALHPETLMSNELQRVFAAYHKNVDKLNNSSSGAIFPMIAEWVIQHNGVVFGAEYDQQFHVIHNWAEDEIGIKRFYTSKYVQSNISECYSKVNEFLQAGRIVLFSGTPCQLAAIRSCLGKDYERLILVECACHGVPSPKVWESYKRKISNDYLNDEPVTYANFRSKIKGELVCLTMRGQQATYCGSKRDDAFLKGFLRNLTLRPACAVCRFKGVRRVADITLADFWKIDNVCPEAKKKEGTSMVMINSEKGKALWRAIACEDLFVQEVDKQKVVGKVNSAIWRPVAEHPNRRSFFNALNTMDVSEALERYSVEKKPPIIKRVLRKAYRMIKKK